MDLIIAILKKQMISLHLQLVISLDKINYFGAINYRNGKFTKDKISLKTE